MVWAALVTATPVLAADEPLFYCMTDDDKALRVLEDGNELVYQFGADLTAPEMELRRPRSEVIVRNVLKPGPIMTRSLSFTNGIYRYAVEVHAVRIPLKYDHDEGGVEVYHGTTGLGGPHCAGGVQQRILYIQGLPPEAVPVAD
ncbi:hypothetical protein SAMN04487963_0540 [Marinobacter zhejiangensis]|uniref:Uncharacterized protein n=1 Tax=Marinobacter zhejiangensis TaxID=488535 RepID=A0A1I4LLF1_9GAMM|nr:hypothetical protein SAMN04487963_0540 [Marinobacter zhejiangensis]